MVRRGNLTIFESSDIYIIPGIMLRFNCVHLIVCLTSFKSMSCIQCIGQV